MKNPGKDFTLENLARGARRLATFGVSLRAMEKARVRTQLASILGDAEEVAVVEEAVLAAPLGIRSTAPEIAITLAKMGLPVGDMEHGLAAVSRIRDELGGEPLAVAEFVGTVVAVAGLRGPEIPALTGTVARSASGCGWRP